MLETIRTSDDWLVQCLRYETAEQLSILKASYPHAWEESALEEFSRAWHQKAQFDMQLLLHAGIRCPTHMQGQLVFEGAHNTGLLVFTQNDPWICQETMLALLDSGIRPDITDSMKRNFLEVVIERRLLTIGVMASHQSELALVQDLIWLIEQGFELHHAAVESLRAMLAHMTLGAAREQCFDQIMDAMRQAQSESDKHAITGALRISANPSHTKKRM